MRVMILYLQYQKRNASSSASKTLD